MEKVLFIGNGINRLKTKNSFDWGNLLERIKSTYSIEVNLKNPLKPFPLSFDEMTNLKSGKNNFENKIKNLKRNISNSFFELASNNDNSWHNDYHLKFLQLEGFNNILTTNYDYGFETAFDDNFIKNKKNLASDKSESIHSSKRAYKIQNKKIWHIHGELTNNRDYDANNIKNYAEESIMIGFGHYARYHNKIMNLINYKSVKDHLEKQKTEEWPFMFFTSNIYIIGFGFDFSESHLWWLLQKRKEYIDRGFLIKNNIYFYYLESNNNSAQLCFEDMEEFNERIKFEISSKKSNAKIEVLKSLGVFIKPIICKSLNDDKYYEFYDRIIEILAD